MDRLLQYLESNLTTLHDNLNEDNFERILLVIWDLMSENLYQLVHNNLEVHKKILRPVIIRTKFVIFARVDKVEINE